MLYKTIILCCALFNVGFAGSPSDSLQRLVEGNQRYVKDEIRHANHSSDRREELLAKQQPFAIILGCSDSRVAPEIIFDQGLGDLFIVRVAGNVIGPLELDSIEYAAKHFDSSLVIVLGHEACGAVTAVRDGQTEDIEAIASLIKPAIKDATSLESAIKENVAWTVNYLKNSPLIRQLATEKKIDCVGAYYHLGTGNVEILK